MSSQEYLLANIVSQTKFNTFAHQNPSSAVETTISTLNADDDFDFKKSQMCSKLVKSHLTNPFIA